MPARLAEFERHDFVIRELQPPVWRNNVDAVGFQLDLAIDRNHRDATARSQNCRQLASAFRIEVHDDNERSARFFRNAVEEGL